MDFAPLGRAVARAHSIRFRGHETHSHPWPHLVFMVAGTGVLYTPDAVVTLAQGQGAWLAAGIAHRLELAEGGMTLGPMLNPEASPPGGHTRIIGPLPALSNLIMAVLCAAPETPAEREPFRRALEELLVSGTREYFPLRLPENPVARAVAIECAWHEGTLDELAARQFTSVRHIQRLFIAETGITFARWRTRARLNRAIIALRSGLKMSEALEESRFITRQGLLRALARECHIPEARLAADPLAELDRVGSVLEHS